MSEAVTASAIDRIEDLVRRTHGVEIVEHEGHFYEKDHSGLHLIRPPTLDLPSSYSVSTLRGVVDFLEAEGERLQEPVVHVEGPVRVAVISRVLEPRAERALYLDARPVLPSLSTQMWLRTEELVLELQANFEEGHDRAEVLRLVGNVKDQAVRTQEDDGVTQKVTAQSGISVVAEVPVENPYELAPYRSFPEIVPPPSPFILRFQKPGKDHVIQGALFGGDGGRWQLEVIERIREWLAQELTDRGLDVPIIA